MARRVCTDGRLDDLRDAGFNPFGSIARAADAILSALPPGPGRLVAPPGAATSEAVLAAGMGCLLAFGLSCWATGALSTWQRTGRWDPTAPLPATPVWEACGGCMLYDLIPNMPEVRLRPLMQHFAEVMQRSSAIQSLVAVP